VNRSNWHEAFWDARRKNRRRETAWHAASGVIVAMTEPIDLAVQLSQGIATLQLSITTAQQTQLLRYVALLDKWNKVYNLTAVRQPARMIGVHILDSLAVLPHLGRPRSLLDVGTGGGLPGIALAIARPDIRVTMLDSLQKKTTFVRQAINELGLANAEVVCVRVENFQPEQKFDVVISRAFAELADFVNGAAHLLNDNGRILAMKGVYPAAEIQRAPATHRVENIFELNVPSVDGQRHLVVLKKA
jgi:16S rRNA (guanine527-N7)-methyltransferase